MMAVGEHKGRGRKDFEDGGDSWKGFPGALTSGLPAKDHVEGESKARRWLPEVLLCSIGSNF